MYSKHPFICAGLTGLLALTCGCGWQDRLIFAGAYERQDPVVSPPAGTVVLSVQADANNSAYAWMLPPFTPSPGPHPMLVFLHGNGERADDWVHSLQPYRESGFVLLLVEYRGYGAAHGQPSEGTVIEDTRALIRLAKQRPEVDANRIVIHGRSLGGAIAAILAAQIHPTSLILESAPADLGLLAERFLLSRLVVRSRLRGAVAVQDLPTPTLILHGEADQIVPLSHARRYLKAMPNAKLVTYACGHNDMPWHSNTYWKDLRVFLAATVREQRPPAKTDR